MSTKATVFYDPDSKTYLFEAMPLGDTGVPAYIEVVNPEECSMTKDIDGEAGVTVCVDGEVMDRLVWAWCRHRKLQSETGGTVGKGYGSPDWEYE